MRKHLRLRGENRPAIISQMKAMETPPLTRRKPTRGVIAPALVRNTSAYAEKTTCQPGIRVALWKHLRLRGENTKPQRNFWQILETPPLTRRKLLIIPRGRFFRRNTSAYAEKTHPVHVILVMDLKHLRLRGENNRQSIVTIISAETPPLTRRKHPQSPPRR